MCLIADIGGTNARFAIVENGDFKPVYERTLKCAEYASLVDAIYAYLEAISYAMPETASLAIATPVSSDQITMTNHVWDFSVEETRKALGLKSLKVLNDYTALALSLPYLAQGEYYKIGAGTSVPQQVKAVLGPGTGLGMSGTIFIEDHWLPLQSEGGHVSYGPLNAQEQSIIEVIRQHHTHVSAESLVSGPGLVLLYESIAKRDGVKFEKLSPSQIANTALNSNQGPAAEAVIVFCGILGTLAGNLALTLGARGGVYIGGGIIPKFGSYFGRSPFRDRFANHGRFTAYLSEIPTFVISAEYPALIGAAIAVKNEYRKLGVTSCVS